jgi:hypothetical protein
MRLDRLFRMIEWLIIRLTGVLLLIFVAIQIILRTFPKGR